MSSRVHLKGGSNELDSSRIVGRGSLKKVFQGRLYVSVGHRRVNVTICLVETMILRWTRKRNVDFGGLQ